MMSPLNSPSYGTQSQYSDSPMKRQRGGNPSDNGFSGYTYSHSAEIPFMRRRKQRNGNDFVKWTMRAVLASPVVVLCLWSIGAMMFANKHVAASSASSQMTQQQQQQGYQMAPIRMMAMPNQMYMQQQPQNQQMLQQASPVTVTQQDQQQQQVQQQQPMQMSQVTQPIQMQEQPNNKMETNPMQMQPQMMTNGQQPHVAMMMTNTNTNENQEQQVQATPALQQAAPTVVETPALTKTHGKKKKNLKKVHNKKKVQQDQPAQNQQTIYYYDPKQALKSGHLEVPMIVYDKNGNPVPLQTLQGADILMEPPQEAQSNRREMSFDTEKIQKWGESTAQDQSIIVATVAVMALLVGALSARRMRSRSFLSSCIENESLEDDVAYDTAYTTAKDNSYYNTFASGGWKGDLEKFDV